MFRMKLEEAINKYKEAAKSNDFIDYEKEFASKIVSALSQGYTQGLNEPNLVNYVESVVKSVKELPPKKSSAPDFELSVNAAFVHGIQSRVSFDCYGSKTQRELADLIFIASVFFRGKKYFEKLTINQFKKDSYREKKSRWDMKNKEQLFLLSRFPIFRGIKGSLIKERDYALPNYSGSLGSYGLLFKPGDFAFVSATKLDSFLGQRNYLNLEELYELNNLCSLYRFEQKNYPYLNGLLLTIMGRFPSSDIFGNCEFSPHVYDFVHHYLRMRVGEPILMNASIFNPQLKDFLAELLNMIKKRAQKTKSTELAKFVSLLSQTNDSNDNGKDSSSEDSEANDNQGIGIIHVTIDLRE